MGAAAGVVAFSLASSWAAVVRADEASPALHGDLTVRRDASASACPGESELAERVAKLVGSQLIVPPGQGELSLEVAMSCAETGCEARIETHGRSQPTRGPSATGGTTGTRVLADVDPTCAGLADALTITLAILLDWQPPAAAAPPALVVPASSASAAPPPVSDTPPAPAPTEPTRPVTLGLVAGGGAATAVATSLAGVWNAGLWVRRAGREDAVGSSSRAGSRSHSPGGPWASIEATGSVAERLAFAGGTVTTHTLAASVVACLPVPLPLPRASVVLGACGSIALARFRAEGSGFPKNDAATRLWGVGGLGLDARGPLPGFATGRVGLGWSARAMATARDRSQTVSVGSLGTAAELPRVGVEARLALTMSIW